MINGVINIYKEKGYTSHDVVAKLRGILHQKKIGHTGTLDPDAQGVLPVCLGKATRMCDMLTDWNKTYEAVMLLGQTTDTQDTSGNVIRMCEPETDARKIMDAIDSFVGDYEQIPPMYSALKHNGRKLYELARQGIEVERKPRHVRIESIRVNELNVQEHTVRMTVECSKGTYIRTLCEDIAKKLNTIGYMQNLLRIEVGEFNIKDSITLTMEDKTDLENIEKNIITIEKIFSKYPKVNIEQSKIKHFLNGVKITQNLEDGIYRIYTNNKFIGTGTIKEKLLKRDIII